MSIKNRIGYINEIKNLFDKHLNENHTNFINIEEFFTINKIFLKYITSGSDGHTFIMIKDQKKFCLKIIPIRKNTTDIINNPLREIIIQKLLSELVNKEQTPHLNLYISHFYVETSTFANLDDEIIGYMNHSFANFRYNYNYNHLNELLHVIISEYCNNNTLLSFLVKHKDKLTTSYIKILLFEIISTLAVIHCTYPNFIHNSLHLRNILVVKKSKSVGKSNYVICKKKYTLPAFPYEIRIIDFGKSVLCDFSNMANMSELSNDDIILGIKNKPNQYVDVFMFLNELHKQYNKIISNTVQLNDFFEFALCKNLSEPPTANEHGRLNENIEFLTPSQILQHKIFDEFRQH